MAAASVRNVEELPAMLNMQQVQRVLGVSRPTVYQLANRANFPAIRFGRAIRVPRDALLRWIDEQARYVPNPTSPGETVSKPGSGGKTS